VARTPQQHSLDSKIAAHTMWANTPDRAERLQKAHNNSFTGDLWHARRLYGPDVELDALTPAQLKAVREARESWKKANSRKGVRARQLKRAQKLRERADAIEAKYEAEEAAGDAREDQP
jgi:hypothetical protein